MDTDAFLKHTLSVLTLFAGIGFVGLCVFMKDVSSLKAFVMSLVSLWAFQKGVGTPTPSGAKP